MVYPTEVVKRLANADSKRARSASGAFLKQKSKSPDSLRAACGDEAAFNSRGVALISTKRETTSSRVVKQVD
jgi:hypothetical protein